MAGRGDAFDTQHQMILGNNRDPRNKRVSR